jgi:hypothetical protein
LSNREFETVRLILSSRAATRGVDAFALALIKVERQLRRLVTHLVFQSPCFGPNDIGALRAVLANSSRVYFEGFERGFNGLYSTTIERLLGEKYAELRDQLRVATTYRNKIFHGQVTLEGLSREQLLALVSALETWSNALGEACVREFGYAGFSDSFVKSSTPEVLERLKLCFTGQEDYGAFIREHLERRGGS